ncbi:unnamed protein product [Durusdinium trenchii]|uniref:Uncharacterized protein n=1 Tax=Durusdinium trenchii TaxID=1381693 RepID=A0ABP0HPI3_9DINO
MHCLFGDLEGAVLLDQIFKTVIRSELSRPIQESTCEAYKARIYKEGLSQLASGEAVFKWLSPERGFPVSAGTFNHRAEALYRACAEQPDHPLVSNAVSKGLKRVKMMNFDDAPTSLYDLARRFEAMGHGPWVFRLSSFVALMFDVRNEFSSWSRSNVDFLENKMEPAHVLPLMHTIVLNLENEMKKWYPKENVARVIFEALNLPMGTSAAFKKLLDDKDANHDQVSTTTMSKVSGGLANFDKKQMEQGVSAELSNCIGVQFEPQAGQASENLGIGEGMEETGCVQRVTATMNVTAQYDAIVRPLQEFVKGKLHLPLMLHPATQVTLTEFSSLASSENASAATAIRTLTDAFAFVQSKLEEHFPFAWVMFASDVSEVLIYRGHFIEGSDQVFQNKRDCVDDVTSLRLRYLMLILKEIVTKVQNVSPAAKNIIAQLGGLDVKSTDFICLCTCDLLMSSSDWASTWSFMLRESQSFEHMCDSMLEKFGLSRDAILKTSKETSSAKTATAAAAATVSRIHTESAVNPKPATADGGDASGADIDGLKTNADGDDRAANAAAAAAHKASISSFSGTELTAVPLSMVNCFADEQADSGKTFLAASHEASILGLEKASFSAGFLKMLQSKLEAALWSMHLSLDTHEGKEIVVNLASKRMETYVKYPIDSKLVLPYIGKVTQVKTSTSLPFVTLFGVNFYIDEMKNADVLLPAWTCKTVTRADIAYFKLEKSFYRLALITDPSSSTLHDLEVHLSPDGRECPEAFGEHAAWMPSWAQSKRTFTVYSEISSLVPLADAESKVQRELELQRQRAEKSARSQIDAFLKKSRESTNEAGTTKPGKKKTGGGRGKAGSGSAAATSIEGLAESLLGDGLPEEREARIKALESIVETSGKLESIVTGVKEKITTPTKVGITKMASDEARVSASARTKAMKELLAAAKASEGGGSRKGIEDTGADALSAAAVGLAAAKAVAEKESSGSAQKKDKSKGNKQTSCDLVKAGKHLLK